MALAGQCQLQDRHARGVEQQHVRRRYSGRQLFQHGLRCRRDLRHRRVDVDGGLEEDLDHAVAGQRLRFKVLDVVDLRGERAFVVVDDAAGHVLRRQAGVSPHDADHRNVDIGKDVGRSPDRRQRAEDQDDDGQDDERVRPLQRDADDPQPTLRLHRGGARGEDRFKKYVRYTSRRKD